MASSHGLVRIGISGWRYPPWRGSFYPPALAQRDELAFASSMLPTIEINGSFYSLQRASSWQAWHDATPDGFVFSVKGPRYITHLRRLKDVRAPLANFLASGLFALGEKLGPMLWQFPPQMAYDAERFAAFFEMLPKDTAAAHALAREHDGRIAAVAPASFGADKALRHAVEVRHPSFADPGFIALLRRHGIAIVVADSAGRWPTIEDLSADFVYLRLHGDKDLYASGYDDAALDRWAERIAAWRRGSAPADAQTVAPDPPPRRAGRDAFVYFDNTAKLYAPFDAARLAGRLGVETGLGPDARVEPPRDLPPVRAAAPAFRASRSAAR